MRCRQMTCLVVLAAVLCWPTELSAEQRAPDGKGIWPVLGGSSQRCNKTDEKLADDLKLVWAPELGCKQPGSTQVTFGEWTLFTVSPCPKTGGLYALDPDTGRQLWRYDHSRGLGSTRLPVEEQDGH